MDEDINELCSVIQEEMNWQLEEWRNERKEEMWEE